MPLPTYPDLATAIDEVLETIRRRLDAATAAGQSLHEIKTVVRGDRARPQPEMPALWVVPEPLTTNDTTLGRAEDWTMPVRIAALVKSDDPEEAGRDVLRLAATGRSIVLADRHLGLAYVQAVKSTRFDATVRRDQNRNLHWADATVAVRFLTREALT